MIGLFAVLAVALAARVYGLTFHSFWFDEAMSTFWAARPAGQIWQVGITLAQDKHPPLYYLMLRSWTAVFGGGDAAVRALGVVAGTLAVIPAFGIGAYLGGWRAATLGSLFLAINPFLVWYSQEARMFMPATAFVLVGLFGILLIWDGRRWNVTARPQRPAAAQAGRVATGRLAVGSVLVVAGFTCALYSYLFSALMLPVAGAWLLVLWSVTVRSGAERGEARRSLLVNLAALAVVAALFLPLARAAWSVSGQESLPGRAFEGMDQALRRLLEVYSFGWLSLPSPSMSAIAAGAALLALAGLLAPLGVRRGPDSGDRGRAAILMGRWGGAMLALWIGLPVVVGGLLLARDRTMFSETRYFIFLVPALCLAWGRALAWLWERWRPAGLIGMALAFGVTLSGLPTDWAAQTRREAWRETAALIESLAGPNDAVLIEPDYVYPALTRYLPASRPIYYPFTEVLADPAGIEAPLQGLREYDAVWLVQSHHRELDPGDLVAGWFGARYPLITEAYPAGIALRAFAQHYLSPDLPPGVPGMNATFGRLQLLGCRVEPIALRARDDLYHPPSGWVHVTTHWTATDSPGDDAYPQVRLIDSAGQVWGERLERMGDAIHLWPTSRWRPGEVVRVDYDVNLNPSTPAGEYTIVVSVPGSDVEASCSKVAVTR